MVVICKKATIKLVKGVLYKAIALKNIDPTCVGRVYIDNIGWYSVNNFEIDGKPLPKKEIKLEKRDRFSLDFKELSKGDILFCRSDNYKSLMRDKMYKIKELSTTSKQYMSYNGTLQTSYENYVRFEGVSRKLLFSQWRFERMPTDEAREMTLEQVLNDVPDKVTRSDFKNLKKIDFVENKNKELMKFLSKSILDGNRHHLNIVEWTVKQLGKNMDLEINDYDKLLDMPLKDILKLIEN